jgi:hypothetical protein
MAFSHSQNTDASGSTFTDVGNIITINNIIISGTVPEHIHLPNVSHDLRSSLGSEASSQRRIPTPLSGLRRTVHNNVPNRSNDLSSHNISPANDIAAQIIVKIVELLVESESCDHYRDLKQELGLLKQTLTLTGLAIQTYECTPLGQILAGTVNHGVEGCSVVLQELLGTIKSYQRSLSSTRISYLWGQVLSSGGEVDKLTPLRKKLSIHQSSLGRCLMALKL